MDINEIVKLVINAGIPAAIGVAAYIFQQQYSMRNKIMISARLLVSDINRILTIADDVILDKRIKNYPISILTDWRNEFFLVSPKLNREQSDTLLKLYALGDHLKDIQVRYNLTIKTLGPDHPKTGQSLSAHASDFVRVANSMKCISLDDLKNKLEEIAK